MDSPCYAPLHRFQAVALFGRIVHDVLSKLFHKVGAQKCNVTAEGGDGYVVHLAALVNFYSHSHTNCVVHQQNYVAFVFHRNNLGALFFLLFRISAEHLPEVRRTLLQLS